MACCNGCGCTDARACEGGCEWTYKSRSFNICSRCAGTRHDLVATLKRINHLLSARRRNADIDEIKHLANRAHRRHASRAEARP